jgi:hypothetical protein
MNQHDGTARKIIGQLNPEDLMGNGLYQKSRWQHIARKSWHLFVGWHYATNGSQPRLFDPSAVQTCGTLPHIWGPDVGLSHGRLMASRQPYMSDQSSNQWGWILCYTRVFPENEWTLRSANIGCKYEIVHWGWCKMLHACCNNYSASSQ